MKKGWKIFLKVIYYFFTFGLGVMIALALPNAYREIVTYEKLDNYVENKNFVKAVDLIGGLYNKNPILELENDDGSGFIIFETNSLGQRIEKNPNDEEITVTSISNSYICYLYSIKREDFNYLDGDNNSKVIINGLEEIDILQYDSNLDDKNDSVSTLVDSNYICIVLSDLLVNQISSIDIKKYDGSTIYKYENLSLKFDSKYFNDTKVFVDKYNEFSADGIFTEEENKKLIEIYDNQILTLNENYLKSGTFTNEEIQEEANKRSVRFVLIYFIWVYILGDLLVGKRYIIKFFKFLFEKIKDKFFKSTPEPAAVGRDFYSTVTFEIEQIDELNRDVIITYKHQSTKDYNFKSIINKSNGFKKNERVHAGIYNLANYECNGYEIINLPEKLEIKGYKTHIKMKVKKSKTEENE